MSVAFVSVNTLRSSQKYFEEVLYVPPPHSSLNTAADAWTSGGISVFTLNATKQAVRTVFGGEVKAPVLGLEARRGKIGAPLDFTVANQIYWR